MTFTRKESSVSARVGLKLHNIVSSHTEREAQTDVQRRDFGTSYDPVPRDVSFVFELRWGRQKQLQPNRGGVVTGR